MIATKYLLQIAFILSFAVSCSPKKSATKRKEPVEAVVKKPNPTKKPQSTQPQTSAKPSCIDASASVCDAEAELARLTNNYRSQNNRPALILDEKLSFTARDWSRQQGERGSISHDGFNNGARRRVLQNRFPNVRIPSLSRENVAMSYVGRKLGSQFVQDFAQMWIASRGHRVNILSSTTRIGVGIYIGPQGAAYATQIFGN